MVRSVVEINCIDRWMGVQELEKAITDSTFKKFVFEWEERELAGAGEGCGYKERLFLMVIFLLIILLILKDIKSYKKVKRVICQINPYLAIINILLDFHFFSCILKIRIMFKTHLFPTLGIIPYPISREKVHFELICIPRKVLKIY